MKWLRGGFAVALFIGLLVWGWNFAGSNGQVVGVDYFFGSSAEMPLWKVLLGAGVLGGVGVLLPISLGMARTKLEARRYRKEISRLESEVQQLRNLPFAAGGEGIPEA
jgi:uncharacterized integral membrane protein